MSTLRLLSQLWEFMRVNKKFWLLPIFVFLILFGLIIALAQASAFAPFIYAIF